MVIGSVRMTSKGLTNAFTNPSTKAASSSGAREPT